MSASLRQGRAVCRTQGLLFSHLLHLLCPEVVLDVLHRPLVLLALGRNHPERFLQLGLPGGSDVGVGADQVGVFFLGDKKQTLAEAELV